MRYLRFIFFPFAAIYWLITGTRNKFYEWGIMKSSKFNLPVINVGNLSMGGTGKTPHVEYLIRLLKDDYKVATLSRGFGRKERGFIIADENATALSIGDEPLQYYTKFGEDVIVSVEADRVLGAMDLFAKHDDIDVLLLDDAYQHRKILASLNILLTDFSSPFYKDFILPIGDLRESRRGKDRADIIIVTKCPKLSEDEKKELRRKISPTKEQQLFFSSIEYGMVYDFNGEQLSIQDRKLIVVTGIAKADPLLRFLSDQGEILHHFKYIDHHKFTEADLQEIHKLFAKFAKEDSLIITTEKDAMRLKTESFESQISVHPWVYQSIQVKIEKQNEFNQIILDHVKENYRNS